MLGVDQRVFIRNAQWTDYEGALAMRGEGSVPRIAYLDGVLELMAPCRDHEYFKVKWARLLENYCDELGIHLEGAGSWTLKQKQLERGVEPDECYSIGEVGEVPDIAFEVNWTSGGLNKLEIYRLLGVREVWIWHHGEISLHTLRGERYACIQVSELLPQIDLGLLGRLLNESPSQSAAIKELRETLRSR